MEKLMALYGISSPSGREGKMAKFIIEELKRMEIPFRQDRYGNIYAVKGNRKLQEAFTDFLRYHVDHSRQKAP